LPALLVFFGGAGVTSLWAQAAASPLPEADSIWLQAFGMAPVAWALLAVSAILTAALVVHLSLILGESRGAPAKLEEQLRATREAGNYQEAWEACGQWPAACLSHVLRPALERIGQGRERVEAARVRRLTRERRVIHTLTWSLLVTGIALPLLTLLTCWAGRARLLASDQSVPDARDLTLEAGSFGLLLCTALAIVITGTIFWLLLRRRADVVLAGVDARTIGFLSDLAYDDLEGLRVGQSFDAGTLLGEDVERTAAPGALRVSRTLTSSCPQCNAPINFSRKSCPQCGTALEWT
jgi:hypothetical protein